VTVRKRILFVGEAVSLAHIGRPLTLAASLDPARYDIHFAWDARYAGLAEVPGTSFHPLRTIASSQFLDALDAGAQTYTAADFAAYIEAERALYAEVKPDLIVADFRLTVAVSGEQAGIPQATLVNAYWSPYAIHNSYEPVGEPARLKARRQLGALKRSLLGGQPPSNDPETAALNEARQGIGLKPLKDWYEIACTGTYTLYAEPPDLIPMRRLPASHRFIGPVLWAPDPPEALWWNSWDPSRPIIYVTLGSTGAAGCVAEIVRQLAELPISVLVSTAGRVELSDVAANVFVADYLPGLECARLASVAVCNGGSGTAYQAVANATPVVGLWTNPDQQLSMKVLAQAGAGLSHPAAELAAETVQALVGRALEDPDLRQGAARLAKQFAGYDSGVLFNRFLDRALS
jgi:UDP:flavonoid glycosyltransferase YjiC (YdhE family)